MALAALVGPLASETDGSVAARLMEWIVKLGQSPEQTTQALAAVGSLTPGLRQVEPLTRTATRWKAATGGLVTSTDVNPHEAPTPSSRRPTSPAPESPSHSIIATRGDRAVAR